MVPNKNCIFTCFIYFSGFACCLSVWARQTVDLPFCSNPGLFISHKLRGSFLALPASYYLRDFFSLALSIILGCMFLSQGMESVMLLSRVQQKWEKEKLRKWNVLESCITFVSRTQQTIWNLGFSALTWQHSWLFLGHSLCALSQGMHGFCRDVPQVCCWGDVVKIPTAACPSAGEPCLHCEASKALRSDCMGLWFPCYFCLLEKSLRSSPDAEPRVWSQGTECCLEKTGTVGFHW